MGPDSINMSRDRCITPEPLGPKQYVSGYRCLLETDYYWYAGYELALLTAVLRDLTICFHRFHPIRFCLTGTAITPHWDALMHTDGLALFRLGLRG